MNLPKNTIVVDQLPGTLPMGGIVANTPIYGSKNIDEMSLLNTHIKTNVQKQADINLGGKLAFVINNVLSTDECRNIIEVTENMGYRPEAPGIQTPPGMRMNQSVHWLCQEDLLITLFNRIEKLLPQSINGYPLYPKLSQRINFYRYEKNDVFNKHIDGSWPGYGFDSTKTKMVQWPDVESMLTMLLYLNDDSDGFTGGETRLYGQHDIIDIKPLTGSCLIFRHGLTPESVGHAGMTVLGEGKKYVARINILYTHKQ